MNHFHFIFMSNFQVLIMYLTSPFHGTSVWLKGTLIVSVDLNWMCVFKSIFLMIRNQIIKKRYLVLDNNIIQLLDPVLKNLKANNTS